MWSLIYATLPESLRSALGKPPVATKRGNGWVEVDPSLLASSCYNLAATTASRKTDETETAKQILYT